MGRRHAVMRGERLKSRNSQLAIAQTGKEAHVRSIRFRPSIFIRLAAR